MKSPFQSIYIGASTYLYYTIRFEVVGVYVFAKTPLLFLYMFFIAYGCCAGRFSDKSTVFCFLIVCYLCSNSLLVFLVCKSVTTRKWVGNLVGFEFLEKYAPKKGFINFLILTVTLLSILGLEIISMSYVISTNMENLEAYSAAIKQALNNNDFDQAKIFQIQKFEAAKKALHPDGIVTRLHSTRFFQYIHSLFG